jgi:hypothetical protein
MEQSMEQNMETRPLKAVSIQQLEKAFATAVSEITNTHTVVTISMLRQMGDQFSRLSGKESFELAVTIATGAPLAERGLIRQQPLKT